MYDNRSDKSTSMTSESFYSIVDSSYGRYIIHRMSIKNSLISVGPPLTSTF